jgi:hypothetical protein
LHPNTGVDALRSVPVFGVLARRAPLEHLVDMFA